MNRQTVGMWQIIAAGISWGSLGILGTALNRMGFSGLEAASLRITAAALFLLAVLPWCRHLFAGLRPCQLPALFWQSMLGMFGMTVCYFASVASVGSSLAVALLYTAPVWSLIFSRILLGEGITPRSALLTVLAACGVGLTMTGIGGADWRGVGFGLMSGICYALYGVLGKRAINRTPPMLLLFTSIWFSALAMAALPATHHAWSVLLDSGSPAAWAATAAISLIATLLAYALFIKGLAKMPASRAAVFTVTEPLTAVVLAVVLLNEQLSLLQYLGVAMIIGVSIGNALGSKPPPESGSRPAR